MDRAPARHTSPGPRNLCGTMDRARMRSPRCNEAARWQADRKDPAPLVRRAPSRARSRTSSGQRGGGLIDRQAALLGLLAAAAGAGLVGSDLGHGVNVSSLKLIDGAAFYRVLERIEAEVAETTLRAGCQAARCLAAGPIGELSQVRELPLQGAEGARPGRHCRRCDFSAAGRTWGGGGGCSCRCCSTA